MSHFEQNIAKNQLTFICISFFNTKYKKSLKILAPYMNLPN